jgi:hypothetical protein
MAIRPAIIWRYADEPVLQMMTVNELSQDGALQILAVNQEARLCRRADIFLGSPQSSLPQHKMRLALCDPPGPR